jgi:hypothetical protein
VSAIPAPDADSSTNGTTDAGRDAKVVELRASGRSFGAIAKLLGLTHARDACLAFNRGIRARPAAELARLRKQEVARLDKLATRVAARAELSGDEVTRRLQKVERLRSDLLAE